MSRQSTRDEARSELAAYLKGTRYEIADPLADNRSLAERERDAGRTINSLALLDKRIKCVTREDGKKVLLATGDVNVRMAEQLEREFGLCARCQTPRTGECVDIVANITSNHIRVHLACVEDGDELA